ncbi:DUF3592 domain-containing protein [Bacteroides sedimenti]|uniref:DUF3592 domain-containing protein n=1 Tax=Bacteroides sedimenti TaxID=2136147 RepID=UPI003DA7050B
MAICFSSYIKKIVKQYGIGEECMVYYNPQKPQKSELKFILDLPVYFVLLCGLSFAGIGMYLYSF